MLEFDYEVLVAIDFDGTLTTTDIPGIIAPIDEKAIKWVKKIQKLECKTILYTCRSGDNLQIVVDLLHNKYDLHFDYINEDNHKRNSGVKINADFYIDDRANDGTINWHRIYLKIKKLCIKRKEAANEVSKHTEHQLY